MDLIPIAQELKENSYPGRGIVIGKSSCGSFAVIAYFIMGRSENSRNRIFVADGDGIKTKAFDESKLTDPSLVIYSPVKTHNRCTIVTNGDQTDTIYDYIKQGKNFEDALNIREFEPDAPNYTPRISGMVFSNHAREVFVYKLSIIKSSDGDANSCQHFYFNYVPITGQGHFIHTYKCDGNPRIPSFEGEPKTVAIEGNIDIFTKNIWNALNEDNKVSLFTRFIHIETGKITTRIINKNK